MPLAAECKSSCIRLHMAEWHFFQGVRGEWRWYRVDPQGRVTDEAEQVFTDMDTCMVDARSCGFSGRAFAVHARSRLPRFPRRGQKARDRRRDRRLGGPRTAPT